jgi:hypothetical protein
MRRIPVVKRRRTSSVLKHGAYAMGLLQGEDPAAFERLHKELVADYSPIGVLQEEVVWDMACIVWRKRHMDTFGEAQRAWQRYDDIESRQRTMLAKELMAEGLIDSYSSTASNVLPPEAENELRENVEKEAREELGDDYKFIEAGREATLDSIMGRFDLVARLDAMLDTLVKRLLHLRGLSSLTS